MELPLKPAAQWHTEPSTQKTAALREATMIAFYAEVGFPS